MSYQIRKVLTTNVDDVSIIIDAKVSKHEETGVVYELLHVCVLDKSSSINLTQLCFNHPMVDMLDAIDWHKEFDDAEEAYWEGDSND